MTAQFIQQDLQATPVAITAVSAAMLEARGQQSVEQIATQAPNVTLATGGAFGGPSLIGFIRGVGQYDFNPAVEPGVGLYVDDVYYSTLTGSVLDLLDLDRVEVLRGPQGTLAGKNSIGGAIKLYTKKPGEDSDGYVEASYGKYEAVSVRAASNFTLSPDKLYMRIAGVSRSRNGYIERLDYGCTHPGASPFTPQVQGGDCVLGHEGGVRYTAGRAALRWLPTDTVEVNLAGDVVNDVSQPAANVMLGFGPTIAPVFTNGYTWANVGGIVIPGTTPITGCQFIAYGSSSCDPQSPDNPYANYATYVDPRNGSIIKDNQTVKSHGVSLNVNWEINDALSLQSITSRRSYDSGFGNDADGTPMPIQQLYQILKHTQKSQELRLNGKVGSWLDYTVGGFYFDKSTSETGRINLGYVGFDFIHGPDPVDAKTWAVFSQAMFHPTEQMDVTLGVRYTDDKKDYDYVRTNPDFTAIQPCLGPPGTPGNPANCLISSLNGTSSSFSGTETDYRAALSYRWTDQFMTYLQYSTGFKGGGVNPRPFYNVQAVSFEPETLDAIEVGVKTDLFNNTLRVNAAVFYNEYKEIQETLNNCTAQFGPIFGVPCLAIANAGDAKVKGAELEFDWYPIDGLQLDGSASYLDFEFKSVDVNTGLTGEEITPYTPKKKVSLGVQYEIETGFGSVTPRLDGSYQSKMYTDAFNFEGGAIKGYKLLNASLMWRSEDKDWQATAEVRNATDKLYYTTKVNAVPSGGGTIYGTPAMPRTWLVTLKRSF